jgi:hypothetical protein
VFPAFISYASGYQDKFAVAAFSFYNISRGWFSFTKIFACLFFALFHTGYNYEVFILRTFRIYAMPPQMRDLLFSWRSLEEMKRKLLISLITKGKFNFLGSEITVGNQEPEGAYINDKTPS